jgi:MFS family permease
LSTKKTRQYIFGAWLICILGAVFYSYEYFLRISPSVMEGALRNHFDLSATGFGLLSAFYYYAYVPMQLPVGVLMDRFGPRRLLTLACFICVVGTFMFANTLIFGIAAAGRFLVGLGSAFAFVGVLKLATLWLPEDKLGFVAGLATALGTIGAMVGDNLLGGMVEWMGWQKTVYFTAVFGVGLVIVLWFGIKDHQRHREQSGTIDSFKKNMVDLGIIVRSKQMWINGMYGCLVYLPTTVFAELWGIPYLRSAHGLTQSNANLCNSVLFLGFTIGAPLMGFISDKIRQRKLPMRIGACGAFIMMFIILYVPDLSLLNLSLLMFFLGLFYSVQSLVFAVGRELSPNEAAGTAIAMTNMIVMIGAMFLQPLVGRIMDWSLRRRESLGIIPGDGLSVDRIQQLYTASDYQLALSLIPLGILIAIILTFFLRETHVHVSK